MEEKIKKLSEPLNIKDIDFRVSMIKKSQAGYFAILLAYKNARVDMKRLDECLGPLAWQRDHKEIKGVVYCGIGIYHDGAFPQWVWKWDAGSESMADKQKGESSDSFKRAGFNWGIGRELYNYPFIWVKMNEGEFWLDKDKPKQSGKFKPNNWDWKVKVEQGEVTFLQAMDKGVVRCTTKR